MLHESLLLWERIRFDLAPRTFQNHYSEWMVLQRTVATFHNVHCIHIVQAPLQTAVKDHKQGHHKVKQGVQQIAGKDHKKDFHSAESRLQLVLEVK